MRIMENKNAPEVNYLLNNEPTRINTVQIANDGEPYRTKNDELEPIQIRTGWHELMRKVVGYESIRSNANKPANWYEPIWLK